MSEAAPVLDLSALPPYRRPRVSEAYWREVAAERIREVYPAKLQAYKRDAAYRETAAALRREREAWRAGGVCPITPRFVQAVMREGR